MLVRRRRTGLTDPDAVRSAPRPSHCSVFKDRAPQFGREERFYHRPSTGATRTARPVRPRRPNGSMGNPRPPRQAGTVADPPAPRRRDRTARWLPEPDQASTRRTNRRPTWSVRPTSAVRGDVELAHRSPSRRTAPSGDAPARLGARGEPEGVHEQRRAGGSSGRRGAACSGASAGDLAAAEDRAEALRGRVGRRRPVVARSRSRARGAAWPPRARARRPRAPPPSRPPRPRRAPRPAGTTGAWPRPGSTSSCRTCRRRSRSGPT